MTDSGRPKYYVSLRIKSAFAFSFLTIFFVGLITLVYYWSARVQLRQDIRERLRDVAAVGALQIEGDEHALLTDPSQEGNETYLALKRVLQNIRDSGTDIRFVYTMRQDADGNIVFIVDAEESEEDISHLGDIYDDAGPLLQESFSILQEPVVEQDFYTDQWGTWLTAYAPFYRSDGQREGIVGIDISAAKVLEKEQQALITAAIVLLISIPLIAGIGWLFGRNLTTPLETLTVGARQLADGNLDTKIELDSPDETGLVANAFNDMASQLRELVTDLEKQVAERTKTLERQISQIQAAVEVGKSVAAQHELNELLNRTTQLISDRFGFYHVGIFLLDDPREYALLRASNSSGGARMLLQGHKLKVGEVGIVGTVAGSGQARIALDVGQDAVYFNNPQLPQTRSEMALPIIAGGETLGVLDIQSTEPNAFAEGDIPPLQVLADQLATALQNARLIERTQQALAATRRAYAESSQEGWQRILASASKTGFIGYARGEIIPSGTTLQQPEAIRANKEGEPILSEDRKTLAAPIQVRNQTIGIVRLVKPPEMQDWSHDEIADANRLVNQIGAALESARLHQDTQRRAELERAIANVSSRIGAEPEVDAILQATAESLGALLTDCEVSVSILSEDAHDQPESQAL
ncbi:MAG: GAF domain-containing protein [Chloroflexota bacterium]